MFTQAVFTNRRRFLFVSIKRVRGGGCECNQHILHRTGYIEIYKLDIVG